MFGFSVPDFAMSEAREFLSSQAWDGNIICMNTLCKGTYFEMRRASGHVKDREWRSGLHYAALRQECL